jgi:hypothetical protein
MPARQAAPKPAYRIRNRTRDNDALVRRGSLTLRVDPRALQAWPSRGPARRGARLEDSDLALAGSSTPRCASPLTPRAAEGLAHSLVGSMGADLPVPDSTTPCRRAATVRLTPPREPRGRSTRPSTAPARRPTARANGRSGRTAIPGGGPG